MKRPSSSGALAFFFRLDPSDRLLFTLVFSLALHGLALSLHFKFPDLKKLENFAPPLEVVLVNAKSPTRPTKADVLAQSNLDGGGNTDASRMARSPLPTDKEDTGSTVEMKTRKVKELEQEAQRLMTQTKSTPLPAQEQRPLPQEAVQPSPNALDMLERSRQIARLDAQISKDYDAYQKRPRRHFIGARANEFVLARYVEDWRHKVERIGNLNYPDQARQLKLYGSLMLGVSIKSDGHVEKVEVMRSSGHKVLDEAAVRIVRLASPFAPFPQDIRSKYDILDINRTWTFTRGDKLVDSAGTQ